MANPYYSNDFKKMAVELVIVTKQSTSVTANQLNVPLKTFEKWITAYNKNNKVFDDNYVSSAQQIKSLKNRIIELEKANDILKKTLNLYVKTNT